MTVAHDAGSERASWTTTPDPATWTHTPTGTPSGVIVVIANQATSDDLITSVSYGGTSMTRIDAAFDTADEPGGAYLYFLGSSVPTGAQTVSIDHTATAAIKWAAAATVTAAADTEIVVKGKVQEDVADPQTALDTSSTSALRYVILWSGLAVVGQVAALTGMTSVHDHDFGNSTGHFYRQTTASSGSFTIGFTSNIDDVALVSVAIQEVAGTTGTIAVTQADQTSAISGVVANPVSGTIAVTQAAQTSAIAALETFLGTIAVTQADQTSAISGVVANPVSGTIAVTQADQTGALAALETFTGTIAVTQADQTSNISGTVGAAGVTGTIAVTQADQTSAISGLETVTGTIAVTQADQTAAFAGTHTINITGTIAVTQADQTAAFVGIVANPVTGTISVTQADQVMSAAGLLIISGSVAVTQQDQTFTASGLVANPVTGTIAVTQADQFAGIIGFVGAITFWQRNAAGYTLNPAAYVPVDADDDPPW